MPLFGNNCILFYFYKNEVMNNLKISLINYLLQNKRLFFSNPQNISFDVQCIRFNDFTRLFGLLDHTLAGMV